MGGGRTVAGPGSREAQLFGSEVLKTAKQRRRQGRARAWGVGFGEDRVTLGPCFARAEQVTLTLV